MPFYLSNIIGTGTEDDPFRVPGMDQPGMGWADLRPDGSQAAGLAVLYLPSAIVDPAFVAVIATAYDEPLAAAAKAALRNRLGVTISANTFHGAILQVLQQGSTAPTAGLVGGTRYRAVDPTSSIYLGGCTPGWVPGHFFQPISGPVLLAGGMDWTLEAIQRLGGTRIARWDTYDLWRIAWAPRRWTDFAVAFDGRVAPILQGSASVSESWPTDKNPLDDPSTGENQVWTKDVLGADVKVLTGQLTNVIGGAATVLRCQTAVATQDQHGEILSTITTRDTATRTNSVLVRKIDSTVLTYYQCVARRKSNAPNDLRGTFKSVAATATALATDAVDPGASAIIVACEASGSSISGTVGGVVFGPTTDTAVTGNLKGGLTLRDSVTAGGAVVQDNFLLFDLITAPYQPWYQRAPILAM